MMTLDLSDVLLVNGNSWALDVLNPTVAVPEDGEPT